MSHLSDERMSDLSFLPFFFSLFFYASAALRSCKTKEPSRNPRENEALPMSCTLECDFPHIHAEPGDASQTIRELRSALVIAHNMAVLISRQGI
jgi:hypothetical protein